MADTREEKVNKGDYISAAGTKVVINGDVGNIFNDEKNCSESNHSILLIENGNNKKDTYNRKMEVLHFSGVDNNWQYNNLLVKHFVSRRCRYYGGTREYSIDKIKQELMSCRRNLILTGKAGVGKSTVLKWLFANTYLKNYRYLYLSAKMFVGLDTLEEVCEKINGYINNSSFCLVFFDGLDELRCVNGTKKELEKFLDYFEKQSSGLSHNLTHRFIVTTRPEHFSFHSAVTKPTKKNLDKYGIYEILPLNYQESLKVCLSIKFFSEFDIEKNLNHFNDKWPIDSSTDIYSLSEKEYKKQLKKYLYATSISEDSMLATPLLCRYAYQIVCDWFAEGDVLINNSMLSLQIETAMRSYIKWEFHDEYDMTTEDGEGSVALNKYVKEVFEFLTDIASNLIDTESIEHSKWETLREKRNTSVNAAFCILQENDNGSLSFVHKSFKDYFLARFYVEKLIHGRNKRLLDSFIQQIETNLDFVYVYAELLVKKKNKLISQICGAIANEKHIETSEKLPEFLVDYLLGKTGLYYQEGLPFTIHDYLNVFPLGNILYVGKTFNKPYLDKLQADRILITRYPDLMTGFQASAISKEFTLRGIKYISEFSNEYQVMDTLFGIYFDGKINKIGGYWSNSLTQQDIRRIARQLDLDEYLHGDKISLRDITESSLLDIIRQQKQLEDLQKKKFEDEKICKNIRYIAEFLNPQKKYWYLFHEGILFVCELLEDNYPYFTEYYKEQSIYNLFDFQMLYCQYRLRTKGVEDIVNECSFRSPSEIEMIFNSDIKKYSSYNVLSIYYHVHWKNVKLFQYPVEELLSTNGNISKHIVTLAELLDAYREVDQILSKSPNQKLQLIISDEKLITFYIFGQGEEMTKLAEATIEYCRELNHSKGEELRLFLMSDGTVYTGEDRKKIEDYAQKYIWY